MVFLHGFLLVLNHLLYMIIIKMVLKHSSQLISKKIQNTIIYKILELKNQQLMSHMKKEVISSLMVFMNMDMVYGLNISYIVLIINLLNLKSFKLLDLQIKMKIKIWQIQEIVYSLLILERVSINSLHTILILLTLTKTLHLILNSKDSGISSILDTLN